MLGRNVHLTLRRLQFLYDLRRLTSNTRSSSISSFQSTLSELKRGQQYLGTLVALVRSIRYIYTTQRSPNFLSLTFALMLWNGLNRICLSVLPVSTNPLKNETIWVYRQSCIEFSFDFIDERLFWGVLFAC